MKTRPSQEYKRLRSVILLRDSHDIWHRHGIGSTEKLQSTLIWEVRTFNKVLSGRFPFHLSCTFTILSFSTSMCTLDFMRTWFPNPITVYRWCKSWVLSWIPLVAYPFDVLWRCRRHLMIYRLRFWECLFSPQWSGTIPLTIQTIAPHILSVPFWILITVSDELSRYADRILKDSVILP